MSQLHTRGRFKITSYFIIAQALTAVSLPIPRTTENLDFILDAFQHALPILDTMRIEYKNKT